MDNLTKEQRHLCMSRIRSKNTKPEIVVRKIFRGLKQNFRTHVSKIPGKPDIVIPKKHAIIFINGCFWHQHKGCKRKAIPKVNLKYWETKLRNNVKRQKIIIKELRHNKWRILVIWECEIKNTNKLSKKIELFLK